jgi:hypothetical protein
LIGKLHKVLPSLPPLGGASVTELFSPDWQRTGELRLSGFGQRQPPLSPVFTPALWDPAMAAHDFKGSSQGCAVHDQHLAQLALGYLSG